jgi:STE24 endopeptidase
MRRLPLLLLLVAIRAFTAPNATPSLAIPSAAQPSAHFNATDATNAWLATVSASDRSHSNAYFEGGYWLILWDFLYGCAVMLILLETGLSARIRRLAGRLTPLRFLQTMAYWTGFTLLADLLSFPLTIYEDFFREHQYGLSNQTFASWFRDQSVSLLLSILLGGIGVAVLLAVVRRTPRSWHIWAAMVSTVFFVIASVIGPVFIAPLFNTYKPLTNTAIKDRILSLAHASGIPATDVYEVDASRQSKRVSANVSGVFGTDRITLNDNLLNRCTPAEIIAVMGHEMGHYVMHHIYNAMLFVALMAILFFGVLRRALDAALARWGERWSIPSAGDAAVIPLASLLLLILSFVFTPIFNTFSRTQEYEADLYGLNAARQPDGEAAVDLKLGEYRKLDPTPIEEFLFFDHPGGRTRIYAAMRWKAENLCLFDAALPCGAARTTP